jgi:hypothetical protein
MASRARFFLPTLFCTMFAPALASAAPPSDAGVETAPAAPPTEEAVVVAAPAEEAAPVEGPMTAEPDIDEFPVDDYEPLDPAYDPEPYDPSPARRTTLELQSGYIGFGIAPGMTLHHKGFHPNTRLELEFGGTLEHRYRDLGLSFGVVTHMTPYYERKKPSFGADVTSTIILGPVYLRTGLGALGGLPRSYDLHDTAAAIGGVVGVGLNFGRTPMVRVGVDYDLRFTTKLEPVHTVFLAVRLACCRKD